MTKSALAALRQRWGIRFVEMQRNRYPRNWLPIDPNKPFARSKAHGQKEPRANIQADFQE
jgi:hypothetical protein